MKKIKDFSPYFFLVLAIAVCIAIFFPKNPEKPKETNITSATLTEIVKTSKLTTAKFIQNGIANVHIEGKKDGMVLYYAYVRPNIDFDDINYEISNEEKKVTVILPKNFSFDVEMLNEGDHKFYYYPQGTDQWSVKEVRFICETHAKQAAENNTELIKKANESLQKSIRSLLKPVLDVNGYTITFSQEV